MYRTMLALLCTGVMAGCGSNRTAEPVVEDAQFSAGGLVQRSIPDQDPGPPFYARVGLQILRADGYVAIPFYRDPSCVPADFNLLAFYDFPGAAGPGAFACAGTMTGMMLIEPDAPLGTFPRQVTLAGTNVPFWFVPSAQFDAATQDGVLTIDELAGLQPLRGYATRYHETLHPRDGDHKIIITAGGTITDGRSFKFNVTHIGDRIRSINIAFR